MSLSAAPQQHAANESRPRGRQASRNPTAPRGGWGGGRVPSLEKPKPIKSYNTNKKPFLLSDVSGPAAEELMALAAALTRAATRLLRGGLPQYVTSPALPIRSRLLCSLPADNEPSAPGVVEEPWKEAEAEILRDVKPVVEFVRGILHSDRYGNGVFLSPDDEKVIVEKVLAHHPRSEDKIGCGLDAIMVNKHPEFRRTRCLFISRTNGDLEDFSYRKCLRAYIERAYPSHADRFIDKHLPQKPSEPVHPPK
uniref:Uncharacterized protein n=1 Tax=Avena sativa TaxID=4498 RepID=A0ACD5XQN8_AVESA